MDAHTLAIALKGEVVGHNQVLAPGPYHSPRDRSLSVRLEPAAPDGFVVHSFAADDWRECRDYVRRATGLGRDGDRSRRAPAHSQRNRVVGTRARTTTDNALAFWKR